MESKEADPFAEAVECMEELGVSATTPEAVVQCAQSDQGARLLHQLGLETKSLDPPLYAVPWFLFNNVSIYQTYLSSKGYCVIRQSEQLSIIAAIH